MIYIIEILRYRKYGSCLKYVDRHPIMKSSCFIEDVFPIENGDVPASYVSLLEGNYKNSEFLMFHHGH